MLAIKNRKSIRFLCYYSSLLLAIIFSNICQASALCDKFPKVIGGNNGETRILQIDYDDSGTQNVVSAVGYTHDSSISGISQKSAIIVVTQDPPQFQGLTWAKNCKEPNSQFTGLSTDQNQLFAFLEIDNSLSSYILEFDEDNGAVYKIYEVSSTNSIYFHLNIDSVSMVYRNNNMYFATQTSLNDDSTFLIIKASLQSNTSAQIVKQIASNSTAKVLGVMFDEKFNYLQVLQKNQNSYIYASAFTINDFTNQWNAHFTYNGTHQSHACGNYQTISSGKKYGYFALAIQTTLQTWFGIIQYSDQNTNVQNDIYFESSSSSYQQQSFQAFTLINPDQGVFLLQNNVLGFITYSNKSIEYKQVTPQPINPTFYGLGKIIDHNGKFYAPYSSNQIKGPNCVYSLQQQSGLIISSGDTCQLIQQESKKNVTLTNDSMLNGEYPYASSTFNIAIVNLSSSDINNYIKILTQSALYSTAQWNQISFGDISKPTTFGTQLQFPIPSYQNNQLCYSISSLTTSIYVNETNLPFNITYDLTFQKMFVNPTTPPGFYEIYVNHIINDGMHQATYYQKIEITVSNSPPYFQSGIQTVYNTTRENKTSIPLPTANDTDGNNVTILLANGTPSFIYINYTDNTLVIYPPLSAESNYTVQLEATDQYNSTSLNITIVILNSPPYLVDSLGNKTDMIETQLIKIHETSDFTLKAIDPENNTVVAQVISASPLPYFINLNASTLQFTFHPQNMNDIGSHIFTVKVCDNMTFLSCSQEYPMNVTVINQRPKFKDNNLPVNQQVHLNTKVQYQLPEYYDPEGQLLAVIHTPQLPPFITFNNGLYTFYPNDLSQIDSHNITAEISDGYSSISYTFMLTVVNYAPYFVVKPQHLADIIDVEQGQQRAYNLPDIQDIESLPVEVKVSLQGGSSLQSDGFIKYDDIGNKIMINASCSQCIGTFTCNLQLSDPRNISNIYYFLIRVSPQKKTNSIIIQPLKNESQKEVKPARTPNIVPNKTEQFILARVTSISVTGVLTIRFNTAIQLPENSTNVNISNILALSVVPHKNALLQQDKRILSYNLTNFNKLEMTLQINFSSPLQISPRQTEQDTIRIEFIDPLFFVSQTGRYNIAPNYAIYSIIPQQIIYTQSLLIMEKMAATSTSSLIYGVLINVSLQMFLSFSMHLIWGMMNTIQLLSYMTLKFNLTVPSNAYLFFQLINDFLSMRAQFLDTWVDYLTEQIFQMQQEFNSKVASSDDRESGNNTFKAMGTYLLAGIALIFAILFSFLLAFLVKRFPIFMKLYIGIKNKLFYNSLLRFGIQSYFKFCLVALNGISMGIILDNSSQVANKIMTVLMIVFCLSYPVFCLWFLRKNAPKLADEQFNLRFGSLYLNIKTADQTSLISEQLIKNVKTSTLLITIFLLRRLTFSAVIICLSDHPHLQLMYMQIFSVALLAYLIKVQPLNSRLLNTLEIFNEFIMVIGQLIVVVFTDFTPANFEDGSYRGNLYARGKIVGRKLDASVTQNVDPSEVREQFGWALIAITSLSILVGMIGVVGGIGQIIFGKVKQAYQKYKERKQSRVFDLKAKKYIDETKYESEEHPQNHIPIEQIFQSESENDEKFKQELPPQPVNLFKQEIKQEEQFDYYNFYNTDQHTHSPETFIKQHLVQQQQQQPFEPEEEFKESITLNSQDQENIDKVYNQIANYNELLMPPYNQPYKYNLEIDPYLINTAPREAPWKSLLARQLMSEQISSHQQDQQQYQPTYQTSPDLNLLNQFINNKASNNQFTTIKEGESQQINRNKEKEPPVPEVLHHITDFIARQQANIQMLPPLNISQNKIAEEPDSHRAKKEERQKTKKKRSMSKQQ